MAITSWREIAGRQMTHRFGETPTAERKFVLTLDATGTVASEVLAAVGVYHGSPHPEQPYLTAAELSVSEGTPTPYHAELTVRYEVRKPDERDPNPLARPDVWQFSTGGVAVPALEYYDGAGNANTKTLVNTAGDQFEGLTREVSEMRATISGNRVAFPIGTAADVTNGINDAEYLGMPKHYWKCQGISGQQQTEVVNDSEITYWAITVELAYRSIGWNMKLPNVGFDYLDPGPPQKKRRAWVIDWDNFERVGCVSPQALTATGNLKNAIVFVGPPDILERRVYHEIDFSEYFGEPPWLD